MCVAPVFLQNPIITFWRLANEIPKIRSDEKLIFGKKLSYPFLPPRLALAEPIVRRGEVDAYRRIWGQGVGEDRVLFEDRFFF